MVECEREQDVLDAIASQRWPARAGDDLRAHVCSCEICADLVEVASALVNDYPAGSQESPLPSSGLVWWRAQLRARDEDTRAAARPIAFVQGVAASVAIWLLVTVIRAVPAGAFVGWKEWLAGLIPHASHSAVPGLAVLLVIGAAVLLAPLAIYFAMAED